MLPLVDLQMPIREGGFVVDDVVRGWLRQDADLTVFVDAGSDMVFDDAAQEMVHLLSKDAAHADMMRLRLAASRKRERLFPNGDAPYLYLADPDVLLPEQPVLGRMVDRLERDASVGAIGLFYISEYEGHVAAGSMLLRRSSLVDIGPLRHLARYCECDYIKHRLEQAGQRVVALKDAEATHLRETYCGGYPEHESVRIALAQGGRVPLDRLADALGTDGARRRVYFDAAATA